MAGQAFPYAAVVLDVDGTLVDTNYLHTLCWWQALSQFGHNVPMARIHRAVGMGAELLVRELVGEAEDHARVQGVVQAHDVLFTTWWDVVRPLPGAEALLHWCWDAQVTSMLASSSGWRALHAMLEVLGEPDLDVVVAGDEVDRPKPSPDIVLAALERAQVKARSAVLVGDSVWDVQAATAAGVACIGLTCGGTSESDLLAAGASATFPHPAALLEHWRTSLEGVD
jgi:phosphoglycolate phosphatase-like HAD superfamily hydrolase